jgi:hypothetical protein
VRISHIAGATCPMLSTCGEAASSGLRERGREWLCFFVPHEGDFEILF